MRTFARKSLRYCCWWLPCCFYSLDANAWGLLTHVYFAHALIWGMPLLDPRLRKAIRRFPDLVMAGACLPDLAVISQRFRSTHVWENAHQLLTAAESDEEIALAVGYASHLYVDVIAHNHFVPAHEALWMENNMLTHIASEWAMDAHIGRSVTATPQTLLNRHAMCIAHFIAPHFDSSVPATLQALKRLAFWDGVLRKAKLPHMIYYGARLMDCKTTGNFTYYITKTQVAMHHIGTMLNGNRPLFEPELKSISMEALTAWRQQCLQHLHLQHPLPIRYFEAH